MNNSDLIMTLCYIVLFVSAIGAFWSGYLLYWLWRKAYRKMLSRPIYRPIEPIEDVEYREVARFD